jgi:hypothetical protein
MPPWLRRTSPRVLADFKRHTAQRILEQLQIEGCEWLLNQFEFFRAKHKSEPPPSLAGGFFFQGNRYR